MLETAGPEMAMSAIKKLIGFLMVFVLYNITQMEEFPTSETRRIRE